ncbi:hypothetical protein D3C81_441950 [compost metagenome]
MKCMEQKYAAKIAEVTAEYGALVAAGADKKLIKRAKQIVANWTQSAWITALEERAYILHGFGHKIGKIFHCDNHKEVVQMYKDGFSVDKALFAIWAKQ